MLHDEAILGLLKPAPGTLVDRVVQHSDTEAIDALYLSILSRRPSAEERDAIAKLLAKHPDKRAETLSRVAWAMLASMEFGVNH